MPLNKPFQEAIDYLHQKVNIPTKTWRDIEGRAHDRAFVVAGATKEALLADLHGAVMQAVRDGVRLEEFTKNFEQIVAKHGWTGWAGDRLPARRAWRARTIYETNLRTAYAAGRYKQMTDPDMLKARPYWQYKHGFTRRPAQPRLDHVALDGLVLPADDPAWDKIYPPNGWGCTCGVIPLSARQLERMGKSVDQSPHLPTRGERDPLTGEVEQVPVGIAPGWDHAPGKDWAEGLIPPELQKPMAPSSSLPEGTRNFPVPENLLPVPRPGRASNVPLTLPADKPAEWYVDTILDKFGAKRGANGAVLYRDAAGHAVIISDDLFKHANGAWKVDKGARAVDYLQAMEALTDPDEIWIDWDRHSITGKTTLRRRYLRFNTGAHPISVFEWGKDGWRANTLFNVKGKNQNQRDKDIAKQRHGALLWRRK